MVYFIFYVLIGVFVGFVAGLFGVGGGTTQVPLLLMIFKAQGFPEKHIMHLALGTSMASIFFTSLSSMRAHHLKGAVRWDIFKGMAGGLLLGTFSGSFFAGSVPSKGLKIFFVIIMYIASLQIISNFKPKAKTQLPGKLGLFFVGLIIGSISSLAAAGGGFLSVPFMLYCNVIIYQAVGTSAALGFPIAFAGFVGYVISGFNAEGLPKYSLGYVYLPALITIVSMSILTAPRGANLAHRLPVLKLRRLFGIFLAILATKILLGII